MLPPILLFICIPGYGLPILMKIFVSCSPYKLTADVPKNRPRLFSLASTGPYMSSHDYYRFDEQSAIYNIAHA